MDTTASIVIAKGKFPTASAHVFWFCQLTENQSAYTIVIPARTVHCVARLLTTSVFHNDNLGDAK